MTSSSARHQRVEVGDGEAGERLDRLLTARLAGFSRSRVQALIKEGRVRSGGATLRGAGSRVKRGEVIEVELGEAAPAEPQPEAIPLAILYEDAHLIVVDKPAGLVVHPAAGHGSGTLVNALIAHCGASLSGIGGIKRPGIVHRLDKDTSGLLVVAKTDAAHQGLARQFAAHGGDGGLERAYLAIVWGVPEPVSGRIVAPLARSAANRTKIAVARPPAGRRALTVYTVEETFTNRAGQALAALCRVRLATGRTHQIRVHMAHTGHPVMGDATYGAGFAASTRRLHITAQTALARLGRQALHASELGFLHPITGNRLRFQSPPPPQLQALIEALRNAAGRAGA